MKRINKSKLFIISIAILAILVGFRFIPVKTGYDPCGLGDRYSIVKGQQNAYKEASRNRGNVLIGCPADIHDYVPNRLYVL